MVTTLEAAGDAQRIRLSAAFDRSEDQHARVPQPDTVPLETISAFARVDTLSVLTVFTGKSPIVGWTKTATEAKMEAAECRGRFNCGNVPQENSDTLQSIV